jgi:hypothetical protein
MLGLLILEIITKTHKKKKRKILILADSTFNKILRVLEKIYK